MPKVMTKTKPKAKTKRAAPDREVAEGMTLAFEYLRDLAKWKQEVKDRLSRVYLRATPGAIEVFAISRSVKYDFELRKQLSDFILAQDDLGRPSRGTVLTDAPDEELQAYFNPADTLLVPVD